jgi:hypothetical protein
MKPAGLAALALLLTAGCSSPLTEPAALEARALARSTAEWTPASLASELPVDSATRRAIQAGLEELHASLVSLHGHLEAQGTTGEEHELVLTPEIEQELRQVHARHQALWNGLDEEVRETLATRLHEHASRHAGDDAASLHERMRRLHGGGSGH